MCDIDEKRQKLKIIFANDNLLDVTSFTQAGYQRKRANNLATSHSFVDKLLASENKRRERESWCFQTFRRILEKRENTPDYLLRPNILLEKW